MVPAADLKRFTQKMAIGAAVVAAAIAVGGVVVYAANVLIVLFIGVLFAVFLRGLVRFVRRWVGVSDTVAFIIVVLLLLLLTGMTFALLADSVAEQIDQISEQIPTSQQELRQRLSQFGWSRQLVSQIPDLQSLMERSGSLLGGLSSIFSGTLGAVANLVIVLFVGLYLALSPSEYTRPAVRLLPQRHRGRALEILETLREKLGYWLLGRITTMGLIAVLTFFGLMLLGVPAPLALALLAGLANFVPNIGPIMAFVPAALLAASSGWMQLMYVGVLYLGIQIVESYILTPLIQRRSVQLAPAFTISVQLLMGYLLGFLGLVVATPLAVVGVVLVQQLYLDPQDRDE
jgi:predicted PurR-regulated permease PerM